MITSKFGPPFDNPEWEARKEKIKNFIEKSPWSSTDLESTLIQMISDLWVALEAEESDNKMLAYHTSYIYDVVSGGRISKPNTLPQEVEAFYEQKLQDAREDGFAEGVIEGKSDLLYEHFGGTLPG